MIHLVIPMAGAGSRFSNAGYTLPKPLIDVAGKPMIERVIENLSSEAIEVHPIFLIQKEHKNLYDLSKILRVISPKCDLIEVNELTDGAARTVLHAENSINPDDEVIIANSDQWIDVNIDKFVEFAREYDGAILTMTANDPKWSFVKLDSNQRVTSVVEKVVVSDEATVGIYFFKRWSDYVSGAKQMILKEDKSAGEYYVAPVYNYLISKGSQIAIYNVGTDRNGMYGLGTPEDLDWFLENKRNVLK